MSSLFVIGKARVPVPYEARSRLCSQESLHRVKPGVTFTLANVGLSLRAVRGFSDLAAGGLFLLDLWSTALMVGLSDGIPD